MPDWNEIIAQHGSGIWQTVCRIVPAPRAPEVFREALLDASQASQRDSVSDWGLFLQRIATARSVASIRQAPPPADDSLPGQLRQQIAKLHSDHTATVFCLRYLSDMTFSEIAIETRATLDSIGPSANDACTTIGAELAGRQGDNANPEDLLESAVAATRSEPVPPLTPQVLEEARAALAAAPQIDFEKPPVPSRTIPVLVTTLLILIVAFGVLAYYKYRPKPPAMAFSQMLEAVDKEHSARYHMVRNVRLPDQRIRKVQAEVSVLEPGRIRQAMEPPGTIVVWDQDQQKALTLEQSRQRAILRDWADMFEDTRPIDAVALLRQLKDAQGTPGAQTAIRGRLAQEFRISRPDSQISVWADVESKLPVMIEMEFPAGQAPGNALMNDIVWGPPLNAALFDLEPPDGYELAAIKVNLKPATEQDLVKALQTAARLNGGKFPARFDRAGMSQLISELRSKLPSKEAPDHRTALEELEADLLQLGRGWMYIAEADNGDDWHYAGQDAMYGGDQPIFWYRPGGSGVYHIISASLDLRPIQPDRLPEIPSIQLSSATTRPAIPQQSLPPQ